MCDATTVGLADGEYVACQLQSGHEGDHKATDDEGCWHTWRPGYHYIELPSLDGGLTAYTFQRDIPMNIKTEG